MSGTREELRARLADALTSHYAATPRAEKCLDSLVDAMELFLEDFVRAVVARWQEGKDRW